ncbi:hypothetical protein [Paraburkholderia rhynchosiae]|uniref:hypothetical protein n=1 Tax=Paraburkholderia rhynchosiae TaxID=487049 RepID=UPI001304F318|nr:hypothetical protein [Paraburkholderia rhynchosiae]
MATSINGKTWTIGQKKPTRGQDRKRLREAKLVRDATDQRQPFSWRDLPWFTEARCAT